jgi:predicted O-linked N-acetylglucosamine transferase (SPINDLY family)
MGLFDAFRRDRPAHAPAAEDVPRADALIGEGHGREDAGDLAGALARYREAAHLAPSHARAHLNIGNALLAQGDARSAIAAYAQALRLNGRYAPAHFNRGNAHARLGEQVEAMRCYREAVACDPQFADAWIALGNAQDDLGDGPSALASYTRALELRPGFAPVIVNIASVQRRLGNPAAAEAACREALAVDPDLAQAHAQLGTIALDRGDWPGALRSFRRAAQLDPNPGAALAQAFHCANQLCDWSRRAEDEHALERLVAEGAPGIPPFYVLVLEPRTMGAGELMRRAAGRFAQSSMAAQLASAPLVRSREGGDRLRIGYLSADFHEHATMHLLRGVLAAHDRARFHVTAYSYGRTKDATTQAARDSCDEFHDIAALSDADAAARIAADGIDLLVDLKGFTRDARLGITALRPAPVVVSWLGYPGSLGEPRLADWIIGDGTVTPIDRAGDYSEALALMPHCYQPNDSARAIAPAPTREQAGLPAQGFVFCSFNQGYKFGPRTFDVWCRLLREVPGSVLWLLPGSQAMADNLRREARARGVDAARLVFSPSLPLAQHLARLSHADLALDTFPYNSHTTGSDALWAGVPLVTCAGDAFASRVAASLLRAVGLPELVTQDWDGYFALAKSLATQPDRLAQVRAKLAAHRAGAPLFDTASFTLDLERLYAQIWQSHERGARAPIVLE